MIHAGSFRKCHSHDSKVQDNSANTHEWQQEFAPCPNVVLQEKVNKLHSNWLINVRRGPREWVECVCELCLLHVWLQMVKVCLIPFGSALEALPLQHKQGERKEMTNMSSSLRRNQVWKICLYCWVGLDRTDLDELEELTALV